MAETPNIGLYVVQPNETTTTVMEWVTKMGSSEDASNMMILDRHVAALKDEKADKVVQSEIEPDDVDTGDDWDQVLGDAVATYYKTISVADDVLYGDVIVNKSVGLVGETVIVIATPNRGYQLDTITVDGVDLDGNSFVITGDHTVSATFIEGALEDRFFPGTIVLSRDESVETNIVLSEPGEYVLDLNGHVISGDQAPLFTVKDGATLLIKNSAAELRGTILVDSVPSDSSAVLVHKGGIFRFCATMLSVNGSDGACGIYNEGEVFLDAGNIASDSKLIGVRVAPGSSTKVSGCCLDGLRNGIATIQACQSHNDFPVVEVTGGSFVDISNEDLVLDTAVLTIAGGDLQSIVLRGCNTTITGGHIVYVRADSCVVANNEYSVLTIGGSTRIDNLTALTGTLFIGGLTDGATVITTSYETTLHMVDDNVALRDHGSGNEYFYGVPLLITTNQTEGGTLSTSPAVVQFGRQVTISAVADTGYLLQHILVDGTPIEGNTFVASDNHVVSALFERRVLANSGPLPAGVYVLQEDVQLDGTLVVSTGVDVVIDLGGHTVSMADGVGRGFFNVAKAGTLTITDSIGGGAIRFQEMTTSGGISVYGHFVLEGGELTGWSRKNADGALLAGGFIDMFAGSTFEMTGGVITGISAASSSVIRSHGAGVTVNIIGGEIVGNESGNGSIIGVGEAGGQSWLHIGGNATIAQNTISGEPISSNRSAIAVINTIVTIGDDAHIEDNIAATSNAGEDGVFLASSQINISGAPYVKYVGVDNENITFIALGNLTEGAAIYTIEPYVIAYDDSVDIDTFERGHVYTHQEVRDDLITRGKFLDNGVLVLNSDSTVDDDGIVFKPGSYTLDLNGYTLTGTAAPYFTVGDGVRLHIQDSSDGATGQIVGVENASNATILVTGGYVELNSGKLTGNVNSGYGGAIYAQNAGSFVCVNGGEISGNTAYRGGAISGPDTATAVDVTILIAGGNVTGNATNRGATIYTQTGATVLVNGGRVGYGTITTSKFDETTGETTVVVNPAGHTAGNSEDVWLRNSFVRVQGGEINEIVYNPAQESYDMIITGNPYIGYLASSSYLKIAIQSLVLGAHIVVENPLSGAEADSTVGYESIATAVGTSGVLYVYNGPYTVTALAAEHGTIMLRAPTEETASSSLAVTYGTQLEVIGYPDSGYWLSAIQIDGVTTTDTSVTVRGSHEISPVWAPYDSAALATGGNLPSGVCTLNRDVTINATCRISSSTTLDLNGYTISGTVFPYFDVRDGGSLRIVDGCAAAPGTIRGGSGNGSLIVVRTGGGLQLRNGTITGHNNTLSGGFAGGAICNEGTMTMTGGAIINNTAAGYGGAIHTKAYLGASLTVLGGTISGNTAYRGGAISTSDIEQSNTGSITIGGNAIITNNYATNRAATLYAQADTSIDISGGSIGPGFVLDGESGQYVEATAFLNVWLRSTHTNISGGAIDSMYYISQGNYGAILAISGVAQIAQLCRASAEWTSIKALESGASIVWYQEYINGDTNNPTLAPVPGDDSVKQETTTVDGLEVVTYTYQ